MPTFQEFAAASPEKDLKKLIEGYRGETQLDLLNSGEYDEGLMAEIDGQLAQHAADNGIEIKSFGPTQDHDDTALVARHAIETGEPEVGDAANRYRALRDPSIRDQYAHDPEEYRTKLEEARLGYEAAATPEKRDAARRAALNRGDIPFATFTDKDGKQRVELGHELLDIEGDKALAEFFTARPDLDRNLIGEVRRKLRKPEGFTASVAGIERQQDFSAAFEKVAPKVANQLGGLGKAIASGHLDNLDPYLEQADAVLSGTPLAEQFSPEERRAFILDYATRIAPIELDPDAPEKNLRTLSTGEVHVSVPAMMNKATFDKVLPHLPEAQRPMAEAQREKVVGAYAKDAFATITARRPEFADHYADQKAAGKTDAEILDEWTANPKNQGTAYEYVSGIAESIPGSIITAVAAVPALSGNQTAANVIRHFDTQTRQRKEFANLVGKDLGVGYDIGTMIAPVVVDIFATKGAASIARGTAGAAARAAVKPVVRGFFGATVREETKGLVGQFVKGSVRRELEREGLGAVGDIPLKNLKPTEVLGAIGRDIEHGLTRAEFSAGMFASGFNRAAGQSYVQTYSTLEGLTNPDGSRKFTDEQVRDMAVKHATTVGTMTGLTTLGFNALGAAGLERIFDGGLTRKQLGGVFTRFKKDWKNMAPAVKEGIDMTDANTMLASMMTKSMKPLWKVGVKGATEEFPEEATQQFLEDIAIANTTGEKFDVVKSLKGALYAGMLGGVMGGGATVAADMVSSPEVDARREAAVRRNALLQTAAKLDANPNLKATADAVRDLALNGIPEAEPAAPQEAVPAGVPAAGAESAPGGSGVAGDAEAPLTNESRTESTLGAETPTDENPMVGAESADVGEVAPAGATAEVGAAVGDVVPTYPEDLNDSRAYIANGVAQGRTRDEAAAELSQKRRAFEKSQTAYFENAEEITDENGVIWYRSGDKFFTDNQADAGRTALNIFGGKVTRVKSAAPAAPTEDQLFQQRHEARKKRIGELMDEWGSRHTRSGLKPGTPAEVREELETISNEDETTLETEDNQPIPLEGIPDLQGAATRGNEAPTGDTNLPPRGPDDVSGAMGGSPEADRTEAARPVETEKAPQVGDDVEPIQPNAPEVKVTREPTGSVSIEGGGVRIHFVHRPGEGVATLELLEREGRGKQNDNITKGNGMKVLAQAEEYFASIGVERIVGLADNQPKLLTWYEKNGYTLGPKNRIGMVSFSKDLPPQTPAAPQSGQTEITNPAAAIDAKGRITAQVGKTKYPNAKIEATPSQTNSQGVTAAPELSEEDRAYYQNQVDSMTEALKTLKGEERQMAKDIIATANMMLKGLQPAGQTEITNPEAVLAAADIDPTPAERIVTDALTDADVPEAALAETPGGKEALAEVINEAAPEIVTDGMPLGTMVGLGVVSENVKTLVAAEGGSAPVAAAPVVGNTPVTQELDSFGGVADITTFLKNVAAHGRPEHRALAKLLAMFPSPPVVVVKFAQNRLLDAYMREGMTLAQATEQIALRRREVAGQRGESLRGAVEKARKNLAETLKALPPARAKTAITKAVEGLNAKSDKAIQEVTQTNTRTAEEKLALNHIATEGRVLLQAIEAATTLDEIARAVAAWNVHTPVNIDEALAVSFKDRAPAGYFSPHTGQIILNSQTSGPSGAVGTLLHELIHAATEASIQNPTPEQAKVLKRIDGYRKTLKARAEKAGLNHLAYGLGSNSEFFAHFMESAAFQREIDSLTKKGDKSFVQLILEAIRDLLKGKTTKKSDDAPLGVFRDMIEFTQSAADLKYGRHAMTTDGKVLLLPAHHGTPHKVDKFSLDKIGTGEGAQAYGWGLYFSADVRVAEGYRQTLSKESSRMVNGEPYNSRNPEHFAARLMSEGYYPNDRERAMNSLQDSITTTSSDTLRGFYQKTLNILHARKEPAITEPGNLYSVEIIPDEADFMEWGEPISEQSPHVQTQVEAVLLDLYEGTKFEILIPDMMVATGGDIYQRIARDSTPAEASKRLLDMGIPGIVFNGDFGKTDGVGARNFVIFDSKDIVITHENGVPVTPEQATAPAPGPYGTARMDALMQMPEDVRDEVRFAELTESLGETPTQADIDSFKSEQPERYAELKAMRERVLRGAGYDVGPVYHTGTARTELSIPSPVESKQYAWLAESKEYSEKIGVGLIPQNDTATIEAFIKADNVLDAVPLGTAGMSAREVGQFFAANGVEIEGGDIETSSRRDPFYSFLVRDTGAMKQKMQAAGYDAVKLDENYGNLYSEAYAIFDSAQAKSTEPLNLDPATGRLIPPSQWGDTESPSILFQPSDDAHEIFNETLSNAPNHYEYTDDSRNDIRVREILDAASTKDFQGVPLRPTRSQAFRDVTRDFRENTGLEIQTFAAAARVQELAGNAGFVQPEHPGVIFVNSDGGHLALKNLLAHEWMHSLSGDPDKAHLKEGFDAAIGEYLAADRVEVYKQELLGRYTPEQLHEELLGDVFSDAVNGSPAFRMDALSTDWPAIQKLAADLWQQANPLNPSGLKGISDNDYSRQPSELLDASHAAGIAALDNPTDTETARLREHHELTTTGNVSDRQRALYRVQPDALARLVTYLKAAVAELGKALKASFNMTTAVHHDRLGRELAAAQDGYRVRSGVKAFDVNDGPLFQPSEDSNKAFVAKVQHAKRLWGKLANIYTRAAKETRAYKLWSAKPYPASEHPGPESMFDAAKASSEDRQNYDKAVTLLRWANGDVAGEFRDLDSSLKDHISREAARLSKMPDAEISEESLDELEMDLGERGEAQERLIRSLTYAELARKVAEDLDRMGEPVFTDPVEYPNDAPLFQLSEDEDPSSVNYLRAHDESHVLEYKEGEYNPAMAQKGIKAWLRNVFGTKSDVTRSMAEAATSDEHMRAATETHFNNLMAGYVKAAKGTSEELMAQINPLLDYAVGDTSPMLTPSKEQELNDGLDAKIKAAYELSTPAATAKAIDEANDWAHDTKIRFEIEEAEARRARRDKAQEELDRLHPPLSDWARRMRKVLTDTQKELLRRYGKDHPMYAKIDRSLGIYLVRSYAIHRDPNLADKLLHDPAYQETRDAAISFFEKQLADDMVEKLKGKTPGWDTMTEAQIEALVEKQRVEDYVNRMKRSGEHAGVDDAVLLATAKLNVANQARLLFEDLILGNAVTGNQSGVSGEDIKTNVSRFLEKKNIPEVLRDALAEIKDPVWNATHTFAELSNLVHSHRMLGVLTQSGIDSGILVSKEKVEADPKKYHGWKPVAASDTRSRAYAPLAGYYANPENVEAFKAVFRTGSKEAQNTAEKSANAATRFMMGMAGAALATQTLGNVGFYVRNPIGGMFNLLSQGHNPLAKGALTAARGVARAAFDVQNNPDAEKGVIRNALFGKDDADTEARILELTALGMIGNGSQVGYTREILKMAIENPSGAMDAAQGIIGKGSVRLAELFAAGRQHGKDFVHLLGAMAQVSEEVPMVIAYNANVEMLTRAEFGTPAAIKQEAARRAKLTVFAKSESSQGVKAYSHNPIAAVLTPFARFKSEVFRVLVNTYKLAREDMRSDNPVIKAEGQKRMASALAVHGVLTIGMPLILAGLSGIGGDEDKALRAAMPDYDKNTSFWFFRTEDGVRSVNLAYLNPYSFSLDPVTGTIRSLMGGNEDQIPGILARVFTDEIFGENIVAGKVIDLKRNVDEATGLPLWLDTDDAATRASKMALHVASAYNPAVIKNLVRAYESAIRPETSEQPWYYTPEGILLGQLAPTKIRQHNLEDMAYRAFRDQARAQGQHWQITAPMRSPQGFPVSGVEDTYHALRRADSKVQHDTYRISKGYESLGLDKRTRFQRLTDAGFSQTKAAGIMQGVGVKRNLSPDAIQKMNKTDPQLYKRWKELDRQHAERMDLRD